MKNLFLYLFTCLLIFTTAACGIGGGDDDDIALTPLGLACTSEAFNNAVSASVNQLSAATSTYVNNPTEENCEAYRAAANNYLDAIEDFRGCATIDRQTFEQSLEDARQSVMDIECN